MNKVYWDLSG